MTPARHAAAATAVWADTESDRQVSDSESGGALLCSRQIAFTYIQQPYRSRHDASRKWFRRRRASEAERWLLPVQRIIYAIF